MKASKAPKQPEKPEFPMRINKYMAAKNMCTRRGADELIERNKVLINGKLARLGDQVKETDIVEIKGTHANKMPKHLYIAYNKPVGMITSAQHRNEVDIVHSIKMDDPRIKLFPLGRLDKDSHGLIILTNDGRITDKLLNPEYEHEKEYIVKTKSPLRNNFKEKMEAGVNIEGYVTKKCKVTILNEYTFKITLTEGKKHQIRRMCVALFNDVADLERVSILNVKIKGIKVGGYRILKDEELETFLKLLGM